MLILMPGVGTESFNDGNLKLKPVNTSSKLQARYYHLLTFLA